MVQYHDAKTNEELTFLSNIVDIDALIISNTYRHRWQIEVLGKF